MKMARSMKFSETVTVVPTIQRAARFHERECEAPTS
jgi:hypothetical protein